MNISVEKYALALANTLKDETDESVIKKHVVNLLKILKKAGRGAVLKDFISVFRKVWRRVNNIIQVKVILPHDLSQSEEEVLKSNLKNSLKKEIVLIKEINKNVIGGIKVIIENEIVLDGTIKNRLLKLKRSIT